MSTSLPFRSDIEGLRGVAVLLVIAFHLDLPFVTGGFIGVDVFYVISGFLIASIVQRGVTLQPASLADFYGRRIKRLLPAYLFVLACTSIACAILMLPDDLISYFRSVRETLLIRSNHYFLREISNYFAPDASDLPLLHTWSLSIEWQYYLLFPAGFLTIRRLVGERRLVPCMLVLTAALVVVSAIAVQEPTVAYFSATARAFEFVLGALVAVAKPAALTRNGANAAIALSVAGLLALAVAFSPATPFPGLNALAVCLLAAVIIRYGASSTILSHRWIVYVGRRSYSLYLWHWPVVALAGYVQLRHPGSIHETVVLLLLIFMLSEFTYTFVERPGIRLRSGFPASLGLLYMLPLGVAVATLPVVRAFDGYPGRLGPESTHVFEVIKKFSRDREHCNDLAVGADIEPCAFGDPAATDRALLLGDSHAQHYRAFVDTLASQARVKVYGLTNGECLALAGASLTRHGAPYTYCTEATREHYAMIAKGKYKYVFIGQRWIGYPESQLELLEPSVEAILASGAIPVILKPIAEDGRNASKCFYRHLKLRQAYKDDCNIRADNDFERDKKKFVDALIERIRQRHPQMIVVDPKVVQCDARECETVVDGMPIYSDLHHLNDFGSETLARRLIRKTGNPLVGNAPG